MADPVDLSGTLKTIKGQTVYEKTSTTYETVKSRLLMHGSSATQFKLSSAATDVIIGIGATQDRYPGYDTSVTPPIPDSDLAADTEPIEVLTGQSDSVVLYTAESQTIALDDYLMPAAGGLVAKWTTGNTKVGQANEAVTSGVGENLRIECSVDIPAGAFT